MATKRRGLGRGLDALIGTSGSGAPRAAEDAPDALLKELPIEWLRPGKYQPRVDMHADTLEDLAESIRSQGVVQPIVVRPVGEENGEPRYEIIAGERRWRASQMANLREVPTVIRDVPDQAAIAMALIENIQRENLNPLEEANALKRLIEEFELTHEQAAHAVGRSRAAVSNLLRLLELAPATRELVENGTLEMGHARTLLSLKGSAQEGAARRVATHGLSVRETEKLVRKLLSGDDAKAPVTRAPRQDPDIRRFEEEISQRLAAKVQVQHGKAGKGKLVISYNSLDELDGILDKIK